LHRNTTPNAVRQKTYADGTVETLTYPSSRYDYFVEVDGTVVKRSDSFETIEEYFVSKCADKHGDGHGRILIGRHHIINGVATLQSEYPDSDNTKAEIKDFYDKRGISYGDSETKAELLSRIVENFNAKHIKK
tara:strand:+ start:228 stop:626 length:399 start_codon:yes stop_codon:yes gene_type:complete